MPKVEHLNTVISFPKTLAFPRVWNSDFYWFNQVLAGIMLASFRIFETFESSARNIVDNLWAIGPTLQLNRLKCFEPKQLFIARGLSTSKDCGCYQRVSRNMAETVSLILILAKFPSCCHVLVFFLSIPAFYQNCRGGFRVGLWPFSEEAIA